MSFKQLAILNTLALASVITVNALANILPINNLNTGEVSSLYPSLFTPAGVTFSIWSVIYLLLIGFVIVQLRVLNMSWFNELSIWFIVSCGANICWILAWHYLFVYASVVIMILLLYCLMKIFLLLQEEELNNTELLFVKLPFTIYFSWICVATIANISALLVSLSWHGGPISEISWTIIMLIIATALSIFISIKYKAFGFSLVTMWALYGIYLRWQSGENTSIATVAIVLIAILSLIFVYTLIRKERSSVD